MELVISLMGASLLAAGLAVGALVARRLAGFFGRDWLWAWTALLLSGVAFALADQGEPGWRYPGYVLNALFAALMATGAYEFARLGRRHWPLVLGCGGGLARAGLEFAGMPAAAGAFHAATGPALFVVSAVLVWKGRRFSRFGIWILAGLLVMCGIELWDVYADNVLGVNQVPWIPIVATAIPLAMLQIVAVLMAVGDGARAADALSLRAIEERNIERNRVHAILDHARDIVAELDTDSRVLYVNPRVEELLGLDPAALLGRCALEVVPEPYRERAAAIWSERIAGDTQPVVLPMPDGADGVRQLEVAVFSYDHTGDRRFLAIARDVSDRVQAEAALRANEALFRAAFSAAPSVMLLTTTGGTVLDANERFVSLGGWSRAETIGCTLCDLWGWGANEPRRELLARANDGGAFRDVETSFETRDGEELCVLASAEPLVLDGRPCLLWQGIDITDRKRTEEALGAYREELEARVEARSAELRESLQRLREQARLASVGTLAAGIAHQINNPVASILATAQYAIRAGEGVGGEALRRGALESVIGEAQRCGRIVHSVLKFARNEPTPKSIEDLNTIVRRSVIVAQPHAAERGAKLDCQYSSEPLPILASAIEVEQVVVNLIYNAIESRDAGAHVEVRTWLEGEEVLLEVSDDGRGIAQGSQSRIFEPFYTTRMEEGGSGLGLSVAHGVVVDHDGRLEVDSALGRGTRVRVHLQMTSPDSHPEHSQ